MATSEGSARARQLIAEELERRTGFLDIGLLGLTELPEELFDLQHLRGLNLGAWYVDGEGQHQAAANSGGKQNSIAALPRVIGRMTGLQMLSLGDMSIADLGPLEGLPVLQSVDCSGTQVSDLGPLIAVANLSTIYAWACRLDDLPEQLLFAESLRDLYLFEAHIPGIPSELLGDDRFDSCLDELRDHVIDARTGSEPVGEAKLVVLGNGRVGKTQLCRRLRGLPYDENVASTHGITVSAERWAGSAEGETLNIWDFGGQDIYHGAHSLFMKTSAVFVVVWHPDFEAASEQSADGILYRHYPLSYWLEYVRALGRKDSPVVVVQSRCDRPELEVQRLPVDDKLLDFASLKPCWYSAKIKRGQGALDDALRDAAQTLRYRDGIASIGKGRAQVLRQLETWRTDDQARPTEQRLHRTLSLHEFRNLCEQAGGVRSGESLLAYLHNLGVVFYRPDLFDARIILDQSWALEAVYGVFDRQKAYPLILSQRGRFTPSLLAMTAWRDYAEEERLLFLSLMLSCAIAFVCRNADARLGLEVEYLAPDMLPEKAAVADQLAGRWDESERSRRLEYVYAFLHPGLMRALLCDVGERSKDAGVYWRGGLWVYDRASGCRALLEQTMFDQRRGRITLSVQGNRYEGFANWLRARIEERSRFFGYPELKAVVDEMGLGSGAHERTQGLPPRDAVNVSKRVKAKLHGTEATFTEVPEQAAAIEPNFEKLSPSQFPSREPQVFVSYAWGDPSAEGQRRGRLVDDLCSALEAKGVTVRRDRDELRPGELISEFMDRLAEGDYVLAIISDKYLRSEYCMYELFRIYRNCADRPERFVAKVIPMILPDAKIDSGTSRLKRAIFWDEQQREQQPLVERHVNVVGAEFFRKFKLIGEFARNTSDMLEHLVDKLQPRDFERQAKEGFREVMSQMRPGRGAAQRAVKRRST